jgi:hypothetical protein
MNLLWQSVCAIAFGAACWAVGDFIRKRFIDEKFVMPTLARHTLAFTTGNVTFSYILTAFGFAGFFIAPVLWVTFLIGIGLAVWRIALEFKKPPTPSSFPFGHEISKEQREETSAFIFLIVIVGLFLLPAILQAAAPPYVRDSLVYHLFCPKEYLKAGRLVYIEGNIFSAFPKGHEVLMTLLLAITGDRAAQGFSILQQAAAISGLYSLTRLIVRPWPAALCTLGYATVPPVIYFTGCGYVEPALLMTFGSTLLALAFFLKFYKKSPMPEGISIRTITFIGFLSGWMPALKYSGLVYLGLIGLILFWIQRRTPIKKALSIIGAFILAAMPGLCWMGWNWVTLDNPVYPMAYFLFGGRGWNSSRALSMSLYFDTFGMGRSLSDYLLLPWRLAFSGRFDSILFDGAIGPALPIFLFLVVVSVVPIIRRKLAGGILKEIGFMFVVSASFFVFGTQQARFWLVSQMLACVYAAPIVESIVSLARKRRVIKIVLFFIVIFSLAWNMLYLGKQLLRIGYYRPVLGMELEHNFLIRKVPGYPALEYINQNLPEHSRSLCVWTGAYGYYINRQYYSDTFIEDFTLKSFINGSKNGKELSKRLSEAGFTHLFILLPLLERNMKKEQHEIFGDFLKNGALEIFRYQDYSVLAILKD